MKSSLFGIYFYFFFSKYDLRLRMYFKLDLKYVSYTREVSDHSIIITYIWFLHIHVWSYDTIAFQHKTYFKIP